MSENGDESDGNFDGKGHTYPAEMLPERLQVGGVEYELGPKRHGANNALLARGQVIDLPPNATSLHVLAAAVGAPQQATFRFGTKRVSIEVGPNTGFLGQGDRPVFTGRVPPLSYSIEQPLNGVEPAYLRTDRLAWVISHQHQEKLGDVPFRYAYLYSYEVALDDRATSVTLPTDERLCIFALSVAFVDNSRIRLLTSPWPDLRRDVSYKERFESP
jgi:alpha-mannosidase